MHAEETQKKKIKGKHHRAPQPQGVPFSLVALMVVLALLCGCALGYMGGTRLSRTAKDLKQAQQRIEEYDLLLAQLSTDESENEILADLPSQEPAGDEGLAALSGEEMTTLAGEPQVVAQFDGGTILSDEAAQRYEAALADSAFSGEDVSNRTGEILTQVLHDMVGEKLAYQKAQEMGLLPYDEADQRAMDAALECPRSLALLNKTDLGMVVQPSDLWFEYVIPVSAKTGDGLEMLETALDMIFPEGEPCDGSILTNARQAGAVLRAVKSLESAETAMKRGQTPDAVLCDVEAAMEALGEVTGRTVREDIVSRIFERFCVGK